MIWATVADVDAAPTWDRDLDRFPERSYVQSFGWGSYKATQGWTTIRFAARDEGGRLHGMLQALARTYPCGLVVVWCPGGHVGPMDLWNADLLRALKAATAARVLYCRAAFMRERTESDAAYLRGLGWVVPRRTLSAAGTLIWELSPTDEEVSAALSGNWRHNLNRALHRNLRVRAWEAPAPSALAGLFHAMASYKDLEMGFDVSAFTSLLSVLEGRILMYACEDDSGTPLAFRACVVGGDTAWDLLAATSPEGRRCYASYAVLWALVRRCRSLDVKKYDLGGIDPDLAPGVHAFKSGTGARERTYLGEWEWSTSRLLAGAVDLRLRKMRRVALA